MASIFARFNPIENVWNLLKSNIRKRGPKTKEELIKIIKKEWSAIKIETIEILVSSMESRLKAVIKANGFATKY